MRHLERHPILTDVQHDFRKVRSCASQLITAFNDFVESHNNGEQTDAILLYFSKVFDKVHHSSLLSKLHHYGFRNNHLKWISSF